MKLSFAASFGLLVTSHMAFAQAPPTSEVQIAQAVKAAPEDRRAGAQVLGWDASGALNVIRQGNNELVCLADNPRVEGFNVACYHKDLDAFMARGRELTAKGITEEKVRDGTRWKEIEAGTLKMAREPRTLFVLTGKSYDAATGTIEGEYLRWVIYVPFATGASTGLPLKGGPGVPWLMDPGTAGAHIMISPPRS